jgi:hypothetical protein
MSIGRAYQARDFRFNDSCRVSGSAMWSVAAGEPDPGDLVSMLDHAAIVETMALACEDSRPDLVAAFKEAQQRWWSGMPKSIRLSPAWSVR